MLSKEGESVPRWFDQVDKIEAGHQETDHMSGTAKTLYWLRYAERGDADFATNLALTRLGNMGYWQLYQVGVQIVQPYVMQGGFDVTEWPTYRSCLTEKGRELLAQLEAM